MKRLRMIVGATLVGLCAGAALAQPSNTPGPGPGAGPMAAGPGASGPGMGMGRGMGPGRGHGAARWGADFTPGWSLMSPQERDEHRAQMRSAQTYQACKELQAQHREQMAARAKERGLKDLPAPRRDGCAGLKR